MYVLITKKDKSESFTFNADAIHSRKIGDEVAVEIKADGHYYSFYLSLYDMYVDSTKEMMEDLILEQSEQM